MDFELSSEQLLLRETTLQVAADLFGSELTRAVMNGDEAAGEKVWSDLAELGWAGILVPDAIGGSGAGMVEACLIADALSSVLAPVPFVGTSIAAVSLLRHIGGDRSAQLMSEIAEGRIIGVALSSDLLWPTSDPPSVSWQGSVGGSSLMLTADGVALASSGDALDGADVIHPLRALDHVPAAVIAAPPLRGACWAMVGVAAALLGTLRGATQLALEYVREREQYGRPIGSFQAIQHLCADLFVDLESSESVVWGAAWTVEHGSDGEAERAARIAKGWCGAAAVRGTETATQVLGGIGVTWESAAHVFLRQAHTYNCILGTARSHHRATGRQLVDKA